LSIERKDHVLKKLDIRGKMCPMTFVYTKLALEDMERGELLEVTLDFPSALKNIPENCEQQNLAEVINIKEVESAKKTWTILLERI
jgi:tRNA 2-thiouridine synthesizing protein A